MNFLNIISNWFGLINGKIFGETQSYVDKNKQPGFSPIPTPTVSNWLMNAPFVLITSPNFVWASVATFIYFYFPYKLDANSLATLGPISIEFFKERFPFWFVTVFGYTGFWHITLHILKFAKRSFIPNRKFNFNKLIHNMFWTLSGVIIWTIFENIFCYLWASNRLIYDSNSTNFLLGLFGVPLWRSWHFYFAHRLLHFGPLYNQVHSLHHRNTDTDPFSGLCMHPIEHLYYYSCILPSLFFVCSPFTFLWNGVHLLLSPAASHSGWEDHFQSDTFHYLHHRYFECNYAGLDAAFMDVIFGTFRESINEKEEIKDRDDAKSNLFENPKIEFINYLVICLTLFIIFFYFAFKVSMHQIILNKITKLTLASSVGFGPIIIAYLFNPTNRVQPIKMTFMGNLFHLIMGSLFCSIPITYMCFLLLNK
jgi:sterol desaturase/sphingolipid hydroxylase (fatty acid hydroxylase superfamily)